MDRSFEAEENSGRPLLMDHLKNPALDEPYVLSSSPVQEELGVCSDNSPLRPNARNVRQASSVSERSTSSDGEGTPEWYIRKLQEKTLSNKHLTTLQTLLRGKDLSWVKLFVELRGMSILAQRLHHFSQLPAARRQEEINTEHEIVKCVTYILNQRSATNIALSQNTKTTIVHISSALNTPHLATRRLVLDVLVFLVYWNDGQACNLVVNGLEMLSKDNQENGGCYSYWFKSLRAVLSGRGRMGSLVGASLDFRRHGREVDASLTEYLMSNILLMNGMLEAIDDLDVRLHHRSLMESSGLQEIIRLFHSLGIVIIDKQLDLFQQTLADDQESLEERMDGNDSCDLTNPDEIYKAIVKKTQRLGGSDHLLSILQHLLIVRDDTADDFVLHFQLIDNVVKDLVMDRKLGGSEKRLGFSVANMVSQLDQVNRSRGAEEDLVKVRSAALELKLEKEQLEDKVASAQGQISDLQATVSRLEKQLLGCGRSCVSTETAVEPLDAGYDARIAQLAQITKSPLKISIPTPLGFIPEPKLDSGVGPSVHSRSSLESKSPETPAARVTFWGVASWLGLKQTTVDGQPVAEDSANNVMSPRIHNMDEKLDGFISS
ncbi:hypothetical protein PHLCEN_2v3031 [Hermanssonia centrifuga]|uniref:GBD/FH3 domain-containing protein n=1 Tax=Hermanssonia centrifuga TaxID=98765 RepID=A0A2R6R7B9_9APHY|nr:hypothetical protein PHLCEN_2v3031 [Hermanssonia centrifuga]